MAGRWRQSTGVPMHAVLSLTLWQAGALCPEHPLPSSKPHHPQGIEMLDVAEPAKNMLSDCAMPDLSLCCATVQIHAVHHMTCSRLL